MYILTKKFYSTPVRKTYLATQE